MALSVVDGVVWSSRGRRTSAAIGSGWCRREIGAPCLWFATNGGGLFLAAKCRGRLKVLAKTTGGYSPRSPEAAVRTVATGGGHLPINDARGTRGARRGQVVFTVGGVSGLLLGSLDDLASADFTVSSWSHRDRPIAKPPNQYHSRTTHDGRSLSAIAPLRRHALKRQPTVTDAEREELERKSTSCRPPRSRTSSRASASSS